jgi:hypothetical protein
MSMKRLKNTMFRILGGCACLLALACSDSETTAQGVGGMTGGGMGGAGADGGATTTGGMGGMGGMGGIGVGGTSTAGGGLPMHPGVLVDDGVVVRYYMDEATTGQMPTELIDSAPDPLNLPITYVTEMNFSQAAPGQTGITWDAAGLDGRPTAPVDGSKLITRLQTSKVATTELVLEILDVTSSNSRLLFTGLDANTGRLTMATSATQYLTFYVNDTRAAASFLDVESMGRMTLHAVFDSTQTAPEDRARIYINGGPLPSFDITVPALDDVLDLQTGRHFAIGNREIGGRSIEGTIFYAAIYDEALTDAQVLQNAVLLLENDDTP